MAISIQAEAASVLWNGPGQDHGRLIRKLLKNSDRFDCVVAFAKWSGFEPIQNALVGRLKAGMEARFIIGLDFYQSEPQVMWELLAIQKKYPIEILVGAGEGNSTFHPKIYRFQSGSDVSVIIGSANLTFGGLSCNEEVSAVLKVKNERHVLSYIDVLVSGQKVKRLTKEFVSDYERKYDANRVLRDLAKKKASRAAKSKLPGVEILRAILDEMKAGGANSEFARQVRIRKKGRKRAGAILKDIADGRHLSRASFIKAYDELANHLWHSGQLQRSITKIAEKPGVFQEIVRAASSARTETEGAVFEKIRKLADTTLGVGPNIITEILQTFDNARFPVLNKNSVAGMARAGFLQFPERPSRQSVNGDVYADFCKCAATISQALKLDDMSQLDALFNYSYFREDDE